MKIQFENSILKMIKTEYGLPLNLNNQTAQNENKIKQRSHSVMSFINQLKDQDEIVQKIIIDKAQDKGFVRKQSPILLANNYYKKYILPNQTHFRNKSEIFLKTQQIQSPNINLGDIKLTKPTKLSPIQGPVVTQLHPKSTKPRKSRLLMQSFQNQDSKKLIQSFAILDDDEDDSMEKKNQNQSARMIMTIKKFTGVSDDLEDNMKQLTNQGGSFNNESQQHRLNVKDLSSKHTASFLQNKVSFIATPVNSKYKQQPMQMLIDNDKLSNQSQKLSSNHHSKAQITPKINNLLKIGFQNQDKQELIISRQDTDSLVLNGTDDQFVKIPKFQQLIHKNNNQSEEIEHTFRKICQAGTEHTKRYKKIIADKIINILDQTNQNFHSTDIFHYLKLIDELVHTHGRLGELTFSVLNVSSNGKICEHDVFQVMTFFTDEYHSNQVFMNAFSEDLCIVTRAIGQKHQNAELLNQSQLLSGVKVQSSLNNAFYQQKRSNKIDKLNNIISVMQSQNNTPKAPTNLIESGLQKGQPAIVTQTTGKQDSLHGIFSNTKCDSISKHAFSQLVQFPNGVSSIADDIIKYLTGISIKSFLVSERKASHANRNSTIIRESTIQRLLAVSLKQQRQKFSSQEIEKIENSFFKLTYNHQDKNRDTAFINEDSFVHNFGSISVLDNKYLARRVFHALTCFLPQQRIYLEQFLDKMHPLIYGNQDYKNKFSFQIYDQNNKGYINSIDIEEFYLRIIPCNLNKTNFHQCECQLFKEIKLLSDEYVKNNIMQWTAKSKVLINYDYFKLRLGTSCLQQEIVDRVLQRNSENSIFNGFGHY
ncbi:UNKNOWN [Stylonychia lemnae]|uniref:EF-hand domain-containing protein n=1 Tax=Stylonychia lemnae TaxID=5949 RepID=A0A078B485_STYLE|nr:UNKNOWN [Stylonychia lemnae]|eukprot:CDW89340.1 UNKNOWN [Stylonychia lemnae]